MFHDNMIYIGSLGPQLEALKWSIDGSPKEKPCMVGIGMFLSFATFVSIYEQNEARFIAIIFCS